MREEENNMPSISYKCFSFILLTMIICWLFTPNKSYANSFYEDRYNGWIYFDEQVKRQEKEEKLKKELAEKQKKAAYAKAREEVEQFAKELEELKYMMIRYPEDLKHVTAYKRKEAQMFDSATKLDHSYRLVNAFVDPAGIDLISNPVNLYGRKIKSELGSEKDRENNKELAKKIELFFFFSSSCAYCMQAEPILRQFADLYGYKVEAISVDGTTSKYFKTHQSRELIEQLGVTQVPTVLAVTNDSSTRFEFIRGALSMPELEERGTLALEYVNTIKASMQREGK